MTDRIKGLIVTLADNMREDDAQAIISAIGQLRGVYSVTAQVADVDHHIAVEQARAKLSESIWNALHGAAKVPA